MPSSNWITGFDRENGKRHIVKARINDKVVEIDFASETFEEKDPTKWKYLGLGLYHSYGVEEVPALDKVPHHFWEDLEK